MDRIRQALAFRTLLLAVAGGLAATPSASLASEDIDTTFDAPSSAVAAPSASVPTSPAPPAPDTAFADDLPFQNLADPQAAPYERHWTLDLGTTFARTSPDTGSFAFTGTLARSFEGEFLGLTPRAAWTRLADRPAKTTTWSADLGAAATWQPLEDHMGTIDGYWTFQDGPDDGTVSADWSWDPVLTDWLDLSAMALGGWSKSSRGFAELSLGPAVRIGKVTTTAIGSWNRRRESYTTAVGAARTSYIDAWGWSARSRWKIGGWKMGPYWSGEAWKADLSGTRSVTLVKRTRVVAVSASGWQVSHTVGWSFSRTYLTAFHLSLDLAKRFGQGDISTAAKLKKIQALVLSNTRGDLVPENSFSIALGLGLEW